MYLVKNELDEYLFYDLVNERWEWTTDRMGAYLFSNRARAAYLATLYDAQVVKFTAE